MDEKDKEYRKMIDELEERYKEIEKKEYRKRQIVSFVCAGLTVLILYIWIM